MDQERPRRLLLEGRPGIGKTTVARRLVALPALAAAAPGGVVVVDELGRMELASAAFRAAVLVLLDRQVAVVVTVQVHGHPFTDALKQRPDVRVVQVTEQSRHALPERLAAQLHLVGVRGRAP